MPTKLEKMFNRYQAKLGRLAGQRCNVLRPNYGIVDGTPSTVHSNIRIKMEATAPRLAQAHFINVVYYAIFGDRSKFQAGDIIYPIESGSTTPPCTIINISPLEECIAIATSRVGKLTLDRDTNVYTNVRFEWVGSGFPGSNLAENLAGALLIPQKRAVLFTRSGVSPQEVAYDINGMRLIETDGSGQEIRWIIKMVDQIGNLTQLTLSQEY